jgi:RNA polymerase-associated protein RTF1
VAAAPKKKAKTKAPPKKKAKAPPKKKKPVAKPKPKRKERIALPEDSGSSSEDEDAFNPAEDGFDEDFYGDADDREKLEAMNEMEREVILAERRENRERAVERAAMRRRLNQEKKAKKREEAESAMPRQQSTRTQKLQRGKSVSKQQSAIEDLKKRRAQARKDSEDEDEDEPDLDESESDDDVESDADSEEEDRRRRRRQHSDDDSDDGGTDRSEDDEEKPHTPIELEDFKMIVVGRHSLEKMVHEPYMEAALTGMFVRVSVGQHEQTGTVTYRVCEVIGVVDGTKRYTLGRTKTVRRLNLKYGSSSKVFCMDVVSSKPPENEEFLRWQKQMRKDDEFILSKEMCSDRGKNYRKAKTQAYTEQMISAHAAAAAAAAAAATRRICCVLMACLVCHRS